MQRMAPRHLVKLGGLVDDADGDVVLRERERCDESRGTGTDLHGGM